MQLAKEHIARGDKLTLELTAWGRLGEAMAEREGQPIFVFGGIPGERVVAEVLRVHRNYVSARTVEVLEPSPNRVEPPCPYYGDCTGCQWQHLAYPSQLEVKKAKVVDALRRVGDFADPPVDDVLPSANQYGYRNHARFTIGHGGNLGFVNRETRQFVEIDHCRLMHGLVNRCLTQLQGRCEETTQLSIRAGKETEDFLVQPPLTHPEITIPTGQKSYWESVNGTRFKVSSPSFFQVNIEQAANAVKVVRQCLDLGSEDILVDAYTGVGAFAILLAPYVKKVIAVEESSAAVADAKENAALNSAGFDNIEFLLGKTEEILGRLTEIPDAVILDPPRAGCRPEALSCLIRLATPRVAYVSCDAETLARDLKTLCQGGYTLKQVVPLDMFPQTHHVECVAVLSYSGIQPAAPSPKLILASRSPRRRELLERSGFQFQVTPADVDEEFLPGEVAQDAAARLSLAKAQAVASSPEFMDEGSGFVIGADSLVVFQGRPFGKPADADEARRMLRELRGTQHQVTTGLTVIDLSSGKHLTSAMTSQVHLRQLTDQEIETSIDSGMPMDKAGAYAVQDMELRPAQSWEGCYTNIVGLPLCRLREMLDEMGFETPVESIPAMAEMCGPSCPAQARVDQMSNPDANQPQPQRDNQGGAL